MSVSWIGIWLLVACSVVVVLELGLAIFWTVRMARRSRDLSKRLATEQGLIRADMERLRAALAETAALWQPYARMLRYLRHPFVIALLESYARRRVRVR